LPSQPQQQGPDTPGRKQIEEAYPHQENAADELNKDQRPKAAKQQDDAIEKLVKAQQELEKLLKQLRKEELEKLLANLEARCNRMLAMQVEVYEGTKSIHANVVKNNNQKSTSDVQKAQQQSDKEGEIVAEADKALKLLEADGTSVAFLGVLDEVRRDMVSVQKRLNSAYVGEDTQVIEQDIIAALKEMIAALKKAQQDLQDPSKGGGQGGGQSNQKLIDLLAELKMIRSLQAQVNNRTKIYGKRYEGEQADDPLIKEELKQLSERQTKIQEMTNNIATGKNQ
jgi:NADH dehydrogenase/NADH:ubiquinone oxidoreductase subunit G